jgi:hypothetical protein
MTTRLHRQLMNSPVARTGVGCLSVLCFILAAVVGFATWSRFQQARATATWTETTGLIEKSGIEETWSAGQMQFVPRVTYQFSRQGEVFVGEQIGPQVQTFSSRSAAAEAIAELGAGVEVKVYHDPQDPSRAVLRPGATQMDHLLLGLPMLFLFFAYGFFQMLRRSRAPGGKEAGGDADR